MLLARMDSARRSRPLDFSTKGSAIACRCDGLLTKCMPSPIRHDRSKKLAIARSECECECASRGEFGANADSHIAGVVVRRPRPRASSRGAVRRPPRRWGSSRGAVKRPPRRWGSSRGAVKRPPRRFAGVRRMLIQLTRCSASFNNRPGGFSQSTREAGGASSCVRQTV
jgi:hypothetical protein